MQAVEVQALIQSAIGNAEVQVQMEGNHAHVRVVSVAFEGLNAVKKQQLVYAGLRDAIAAGSVHAVHIKAYTPAEWQAQQG